MSCSRSNSDDSSLLYFLPFTQTRANTLLNVCASDTRRPSAGGLRSRPRCIPPNQAFLSAHKHRRDEYRQPQSCKNKRQLHTAAETNCNDCVCPQRLHVAPANHRTRSIQPLQSAEPIRSRCVAQDMTRMVSFACDRFSFPAEFVPRMCQRNGIFESVYCSKVRQTIFICEDVNNHRYR